MKKVHFICYDEQCKHDTEVMPLIAIFTVSDQIETKDMEIAFRKHINELASCPEDCPVMRYAADLLCEEYGATVEFVEADQVFGIPEQNHTVCPECGCPLSEDHDSTAASPHNEGFSDETEICWMCHIDMLERGELTRCESCQECFTYNHLLPNKDGPDKTIEICPFCGEIWCG